MVLLTNQQLSELKRKLQRHIPQSNCILGAIRNVEDGRLTAYFHADSWPEVSAVVCQIFHPRLSDIADLICFATTSEALLKVLKDGDLITWGKRQTLEQVDQKHAVYIMKHLKSPIQEKHSTDVGFKSVFEGSLFYLPDHVPLGSDERKCVPRFTIRHLKTEHGAIVAERWGGKRIFQDWPNFTSFFEGMIENLISVGVYSSNGDTSPVAAGIQFACGRLGNLFTKEDYRRQGLGTTVMQMLAQQSRDIGLIPECNIAFGNPNIQLVTKLGFIECEDFKPNRLIVVSPCCR